MERVSHDHLFFTEHIVDGRACLEADEMRHAITVLRRRVGDCLDFTNGKGTIYQGRITDIGRKETWIEIESEQLTPAPAYQVIVGMAPTKSFDRIAWSIEKLTEIGIHAFVPLMCARAERQKWSAERVRKIAISAMKQSRRAYLPELFLPHNFADALALAPPAAQKFIAVQSPDSVSINQQKVMGSDVFLLIGPEGDFTSDEVQLARDNNFVPLSLGEFRLRSETAAVVAAVMIHTLNQV